MVGLVSLRTGTIGLDKNWDCAGSFGFNLMEDKFETSSVCGKLGCLDVK